MKFPIQLAGATAIFALASCGPIDALMTVFPDNPEPIEQGQPETLTPDQQRLQDLEQQRIAEQQAELIRQQQQLTNPNPPSNNTTTNNQTGPQDYPYASKVPGKEGFVFSPYNKQVVDVRGIPNGTLVMDPTYPASAKKFFRVP